MWSGELREFGDSAFNAGLSAVEVGGVYWRLREDAGASVCRRCRQEPRRECLPQLRVGPRFRVVFRGIGECLEWCDVSEASESGSIVCMDQIENEAVSLVVGCEAVFVAVSGCRWSVAQSFGDAAVEPFHHAVGLRREGLDEAVFDISCGAYSIEGMAAGRFALGLVLHVDRKAVGELGSVVGQDDMDRIGKGIQEAFEAGGNGLGRTAVDDLDIDKAGCPIYGDEDVALLPTQGRQMLQVGMDEADTNLFEGADLRRRGNSGDSAFNSVLDLGVELTASKRCKCHAPAS